MNTAELMARSPVIPVAVIPQVEQAVPLAQALVRGGIGVIEVTLRTQAGLEAMRRIAEEVPEVTVGAGTVTTAEQAQQAAAAGAQFLVTPGSPPRLLDAVLETGLPLLPGAATLTEMLALLDRGLPEMKFFPALAAGGTAYLSAVRGPLPEATFCPTGGVSVDNAQEFLALPNVACVGGSWLTPKDALQAGDWDRVTQLAAQAAQLRG